MENSNIRRKVLGSFDVCLCFPEEIVLCLSWKFNTFEPLITVQSHRRFHLGIWKTSEQAYRKLQYAEKFCGKFQGLSGFPRKMVLCLWSKFSILKHCTNIQSFRRLELHFWQTSKQIYGNFNIKKNFFQSFKVCLAASKRWFSIFQGNFTFLSFVPIFSH